MKYSRKLIIMGFLFSVAGIRILAAADSRELHDELHSLRRMYDAKSLEELHNTILENDGQKLKTYEEKMNAAEGYLFRADESRYERYGLELTDKEIKKYRKRQAAWGSDGLKLARDALKLAETSQQKVDAMRVMSELYAHQITGVFSAASKGPDAKFRLEEALKINPDDPECNRVLGIMYLYNPVSCDGDVKKAIESFQKAIQEKPDEDIFYYYLSLAYQADQDQPKALEAAEHAIELNERNIYAVHLKNSLVNPGGDAK